MIRKRILRVIKSATACPTERFTRDSIIELNTSLRRVLLLPKRRGEKRKEEDEPFFSRDNEKRKEFPFSFESLRATRLDTLRPSSSQFTVAGPSEKSERSCSLKRPTGNADSLRIAPGSSRGSKTNSPRSRTALTTSLYRAYGAQWRGMSLEGGERDKEQRRRGSRRDWWKWD